MSEDRPLCKCHGEPMGWNIDRRCTRGGFWRCLVRHREHSALRRDTFPDLVREQDRLSYRRVGWVSTRRRRLAVQRNQILAKLADLEREEQNELGKRHPE